jgi:hypothetical protein
MDAVAPPSSRTIASSMAFLRNENTEHNSKTPRTKTLNAAPKTTTIRRALGDISNRKAPNANYAPFSDVKAVAATVKSTLRATAVAVPPSPPPPILPRAVGSKVSFRADQLLPPLETLRSQLDVDNDHDDDDEATIERPAGRLWRQQEPHLDDHAFLNVSLEGATTFRDEWKDALDAQHAERVSEYQAALQPSNDCHDEQQERWARLQEEDDDDNALQLGFALYNDQGNDTMTTTPWKLLTRCARARWLTCFLFPPFCRIGFHGLERLERRLRQR